MRIPNGWILPWFLLNGGGRIMTDHHALMLKRTDTGIVGVHAPTRVLIGVASNDDAQTMEGVDKVMGSIWPTARFQVVDALDILNRVRADDADISHKGIDLFEDMYIRSRGHFKTEMEYLQWKSAMLKKMHALWESPALKNENHFIFLVPYWVLYPEWFPSVMTPSELGSTILISPISVTPPPISHFTYLTLDTLSPRSI